MTAATTLLDPAPSAADKLDWLAQRCAAADELWALGYTPESYAIMRQGLSEATALLAGAREVPAVLLDDVRALLAEAETLAVPRARSEFSRGHAAWLERARLTSHRLQHAIARSKRRPMRRALWLGGAACVLVIAVLVGFLWWRGRLYAHASESYDAAVYPAQHAVDGLRATEWLLPDGKRSHIDISLATRRPVRCVTIVNAHNRAYMDRAIKKATVLVYDDNLLVDRAEVTFDKVEAKPVPKRVIMKKGKEATRVRIMIAAHHGLGGGIAEVAIE